MAIATRQHHVDQRLATFRFRSSRWTTWIWSRTHWACRVSGCANSSATNHGLWRTEVYCESLVDAFVLTEYDASWRHLREPSHLAGPSGMFEEIQSAFGMPVESYLGTTMTDFINSLPIDRLSTLRWILALLSYDMYDFVLFNSFPVLTSQSRLCSVPFVAMKLISKSSRQPTQ